VANQIIGICIRDLVESSQARVLASNLVVPDDARSAQRMLIAHGDEVAPLVAELQAFLYEAFYRHPDLMALSEYAKKVLAHLFECYTSRPAEMSPWYQNWSREVGVERAVCDYLAGMTDRFAEQEFARMSS
jgi:dGTPase